MWFKNIKSGIKWEVENKDIIKRLQNDEEYEEIKVSKRKPKVLNEVE